MDFLDSPCTIDISCNATEGSNISDFSSPLCLALCLSKISCLLFIMTELHQICPPESLALDQLYVHFTCLQAWRGLKMRQQAVTILDTGFYCDTGFYLDDWWAAGLSKNEEFWATGQCSQSFSSGFCEIDKCHVNHWFLWKDNSWSEGES